MDPQRTMDRRPIPIRWWTMVLFLSLAVSALAAEPSFPPLTGRVVDDAGVLSPATVEKLSALLAKHEQATGQQVVVVTLKSLQGSSIEDFGYQLGRQWGIGQKDKNTGALLIVAPNEHEVRIEVGYGLEGRLTDANSRTIIEKDILPEFRRSDFDAGVLAGTTSILEVLGGGVTAETEPDGHTSVSPGITGIAGLIALICVLLLMRRASRGGPGIYRRVGRNSGFGSFPNDDFEGGSGGGFSGGGGSFGGGGASGSW